MVGHNGEIGTLVSGVGEMNTSGKKNGNKN